MSSDEKISETERWLKKIQNSEHRKDRTELKDNVSAFLNCVNSIPDYLLEEYNKKFQLGITLNDKLYPSDFKREANQQNNKKALQFILDFKSEKNKIESDSVGKILTKKRDLDTHRESQRPNKLVAIAGGLKNSNDAFFVNFQGLSGNIDDNCERLLDLMKHFVTTMRTNFP